MYNYYFQYVDETIIIVQANDEKSALAELARFIDEGLALGPAEDYTLLRITQS